MTRFVLLMVLALPAWAEPGASRYAPDQLMVARRALNLAEQSLRRGEIEAAAAFAAQAAIDARLTWAMTDSQFIREQAAEVYFTASSLKEKP